MKRITSFLVALALLIPVAGFSVGNEKNTKGIREFTLSNGLTVILDENHSQPEVFGLVIVKAGGKNDPADATGMAHYQEHMLFKGTTTLGTVSWEKEKPHVDKIFQLYDELGKTTDEAKRTEIQKQINEESLKAAEYAIPNELSNLINEMGGTRVNAGTGPDYTVYYNKFPSNQINRWLDLYAHRFSEPVFRSFQAELEVVYEEKNLYNDQFQTRLLEEFQKQFFKNHPYGQQTIIGTIEDLKNPSLTKMYEFFKTYYVPNNMALVISGDFNADDIIPVIEEKFGTWQRGDVPPTQKWDEAPFNGREFHQAKLTPIKLGLLGFRAPSSTDKDYLKAEVISRLLNNSYSTGLLDALSIEGKILAAQAIQMPYQDHGAIIMFFVPKIIGQKLESAEALILAELEKLKRGEFDEQTLESIKKEMYRNHITGMEDIEDRALLFSDAFVKGQSIAEALDYPNQVMAITKDDVVAMANRIFGKDFMAFYSKMGFPKKEKIEKPDYKPLQANTNARSEYAKHFETIPAFEPNFKTIDFAEAVERSTISNGIELLRVENPLNDVFSLTIEYKVGDAAIPMLEYASQGMAMGGAGDYSVSQLKEEFAKIGTSYSIWSTRNSTYIDIQGLEANLPRTLELVGLIVSNPTLDQSKIKTIIDGEKTNRKMERSEPDNVAQALLEYGLYSNESSYLNRLPLKQVKKLQAADLVAAFKKATTYTGQIRFSGKTSLASVSDMVKQYIPFAENPATDATLLDQPTQQYTENTILFVNKPKARQSKMFVFVNGQPFTKDKAVAIEAFNNYFGGGFNGLILQEIREYRSLAYSAGGSFRMPRQTGKPYNFIGYVGTQADKTLIAMETFDGLIRNMPEKPERTGMIRSYLQLSAQTDRPSFRGLAASVERWKTQGYDKDPVLYKLPEYKNITWETIKNFYTAEMQYKPAVYMIVGDKKSIDMKELAKYGKIVEVKEKALFTK